MTDHPLNPPKRPNRKDGSGHPHGPGPGRARRLDRMLHDEHDDPYRPERKSSEPLACDCGAVYRSGRWQWRTSAWEPPTGRCPACQRAHDDYPAGLVQLEGPFFKTHRDEILALAHHVACRQTAEHPLQRVMAIDEQKQNFAPTEPASRVVIKTTDLHLARALGKAIQAAYQGELEYEYPKGADLLRVRWRR